MKGEFERILIVTNEEQKMISRFMLDIMEEVFGLDFEETPEDLADIMYAISMQNPRAYLLNDKGTITIKYQND